MHVSPHPTRHPAKFAKTTKAVAWLAAVALAIGVGAMAPSYANARSDAVHSVFAEQLEVSGVPAGAFAVVTEEGVEAAGVGTAGDGDATAGTQFVVGSTTKSFTALAVMQLVDSGDVDLDASVRDYVPELTLAEGEPVDTITVRHLLQQTSGLDDVAGGPLLASAGDGTPLEAVAELEDAGLVSPPGQVWRYANINFVLAGLVVERASGMRYADYLEQRIFTPLGMLDTTADVGVANPTPGHQFWFGMPVESGPTVRQAVMAAGYLVSTADDLGRYLAMYLAGGRAADGTRVVSATGLETLLTPGPEAQLGPWAEGSTARYAMGWFVGGPWAADAVFHPGNSPDSSAMLTLFPDDDTAVATVVNAGHELPVPGNPALTDRIARNTVHAALGEPVPGAPTLTTLYLVFDLVSLLLIVLAGVGVARAVMAWRRGLRPTHPALAAMGVVLRIVGVALLVLAPTWSTGWASAWTWAPDLALVIACVALLLTAATTLRLGLLLRRTSSSPAPSTERERHVLAGA